MNNLKKLWAYLKGKKRNIGICLFALLTWANIQFEIPVHTQTFLAALLTAWGFVGIADGTKEIK